MRTDKALAFVKSVSGVKVWKNTAGKVSTVEGKTDVGTYGITPKGVDFSIQGLDASFTHEGMAELLRGVAVQGFRKNDRESFGSTVVFTSATAELHLDVEVYEAARALLI